VLEARPPPPPRARLESEVRALHATFEDAGMPGALRRLHNRLRLDFARQLEQLLPPLPEWVHGADFDAAVARCNPDLWGTTCLIEAMDLVRAQRRVTQLLLLLAAGHDQVALEPEPRQPVRVPEEQDPQSLAATVRLCFGEMLEAYAAHRALLTCDATTVPAPTATARVQAEFAQLGHDAYLASLWTSAHVEYLTMVDDLYKDQYVTPHEVNHAGDTLYTPPARTAALIDSLAVPTPELHSVACASNVVDLCALYERVACPRACAKASRGLLAIFARVTNAGSRGWESTLNDAIKGSDGAVRVCTHAIGVALAGLHPCLHPAARRPWRLRFAIGRYWRSQSTTAFKEIAKRCPTAIKEAMRLHLALLLNEDVATLEALAAAHQPAGQLGIPPRCVAPASLQSAMHAFAAVGELVLSPEEARPVAEIVASLLTTEPRSRKKAPRPPAPAAAARPPAHLPAQLLLIGPAAAAASKRRGGEAAVVAAALASGGHPPQGVSPLLFARLSSSAVGPTTMASAASFSATAVVAGLLSASFRAEFVPFWLHSQAHGARASRLDAVQYRALHTQSPAHQLCARLPEADRLRAQRLALRVPSASLLTVQDVLALLGIEPPSVLNAAAESSQDAAEDEEEAEDGAVCGTSSRLVQEAETLVLSLEAADAATLITFVRAAALRAQLLTYDLGPRTRAAQATAICRRLLLPLAEGESAEDAALNKLPTHCTHVFVCSECRRVANACQNGEGKDLAFNEVGLAASMLRIDGDVKRGTMKCAKRSSAALRTAVSLEQAAHSLAVETLPLDAAVPVDLRPASVVQAAAESRPVEKREATASEVAKLRRDIKNCEAQRERAVACGDVPLVKVPILGRAMRIFGEWHALCAWCGCLAKISPDSRVGGEVCCMRCDFGMLHGKAAAAETIAQEPKAPQPICRFCNKAQTENGTSKWKQVAAPADTGGPNANVPPPLRTAWYCPAHWRAWYRFHSNQRHKRRSVVVRCAQVAHGAPEHADERHLCAHLLQGAAHVWGRQGRWRRAGRAARRAGRQAQAHARHEEHRQEAQPAAAQPAGEEPLEATSCSPTLPISRGSLLPQNGPACVARVLFLRIRINPAKTPHTPPTGTWCPRARCPNSSKTGFPRLGRVPSGRAHAPFARGWQCTAAS